MVKRNHTVLFGCVADDFTGASDAASFLAKQGVQTILCNGIPDPESDLPDCQAVVIALKTRSISPIRAAHEVRAALFRLDELGAKQFYVKYCSTFDSTPTGNIGPSVDAAMEVFHVPYTLLCPSLPVNGRTVRGGKLFVNGVPLNESHMKNHPLNPMWDSNIAMLMKPQGKYPCLILNAESMRESSETILTLVEKFHESHEHFYIIPDYETDEQGARIADLFSKLQLFTGGSGLLEHLAPRLPVGSTGQRFPPAATEGRGIILCGSCSGQRLNRFAFSRRKVDHTLQSIRKNSLPVNKMLIRFGDLSKVIQILMY